MDGAHACSLATRLPKLSLQRGQCLLDHSLSIQEQASLSDYAQATVPVQEVQCQMLQWGWQFAKQYCLAASHWPQKA